MKNQNKDTTKNKYCVYIHYNSNQPFYVGYGVKKRSTDTGSRNKDWNLLVESLNGIYKIRIYEDNLNLDSAVKLEKILIKKYGRIGFEKDGTLVNKSVGGRSGALGSTHKQPQWLTEKLARIFKGRKISIETRKKISESNKDKKKTKEHSLKISESKFNSTYTHSKKTREIISKRNKKPKPKLKKSVIQLDKQKRFIRLWDSISDAQTQMTGHNVGGVSQCCLGKQETAYGYRWKYGKENT
jgi:hypothetical protein